jgi:hypothetical protein
MDRSSAAPSRGDIPRRRADRPNDGAIAMESSQLNGLLTAKL